jgi:serine/threonine-protein kinase
MDSKRWKEISDLAAVAAETGPEEREALLRARPELRAEVESLLRYLDEDSGPLDRPPALEGGGGYAGQRIGAYRVIRELGRGGMGVVLLAERDDPSLAQQVAIKLTRVSFQSEFYARRFLDERQILATLEHPNIARLLDGGVTEDGTPYLVMQYVDGVPLQQWAEAKTASFRERIEVMLKICAAVAYAHENLVVHRDLKPGNLLVTAAGEPMLLDFGTARLLEPAEQTGTTQTSLPMLTARYASPEQVAGMAGSARSDVYSLGVILYELLTGEWPYETENESVPALLRAVSEREPRRPSRVAKQAAASRQLAGDLDAILLKALEKAPERRYGAVLQFADDLRRHLAHEPVEARVPTVAYRAGRFLRRHALASTAAALAVFSLAGATAYSVRQAAIAEQEREKAVQVAMFLEQLLGASKKGGVSALATGGSELKVVDVIEAAASTVGEEFRESPDIEVGLRSTIGSALMALGENKKARPHVERAVELSERLYGDNHAATTRALSARGRLRMAEGNYAGAQADLERTVAWHRATNSQDISFQHSLLAEAYFRQGDLQGARRNFEEALKAMRAQFGDKHITTATMISNLGVVTDDAGDAAAAERHFAEAAAILRELPGPPANLLFPLGGLQRAYFFRGDYRQARIICEEAYAHARKTSGERSLSAIVPAMNLALVKAHLGDADAESLAGETVGVARERYPPRHIEISRSLTTYGRILIALGKPAQAEPLLREAADIARGVFAKDNWRPAESRVFLGASLAQQGKAEEAARVLRDGLREMNAVLPATHPRVLEAQRIHDRCLAGPAAGCTL